MLKGYKNKWIILAILIACGIVIYSTMIKRYHNTIKVTVEKPLDLSKVKIESGCYSINSESDEALVNNGLTTIVFSDNSAKPFETICGENDFFIIYDNQYYTILRHFIENDFVTGIPSPNEYRFHLEKESDTINVTLEIFGPDSEKFEKQMAKIENAKNNIWGRPKKMNEYLCY